jgi:hypothetical protein
VFGATGELTLPQGSTISESAGSGVVIGTSVTGIPTGIADLINQGGWNQGSYVNTATTGGTGVGLTVDVAGGGGYINTSSVTINNPGTGYTVGDVITINNENNLPATFVISTVTNVLNNWTFSNTGTVTFPDATVQRTAYPTGQQTVYLNTASTATSIDLTDITVPLFFITTEAGYLTGGQTHYITLPFGFEAVLAVGTKVRFLNRYNGIVEVSGWPGFGGYQMAAGATIELIYYYDVDYGGYLWWVTNTFLWD